MMDMLTLWKTVSWDGWVQVAANVRQKLSDLGFEGKVDVRLEDGNEHLIVCHDHFVARFLRSRTALLLGHVTGVGLFTIPHVLALSRHASVKSKFLIHTDPTKYWDLISIGISAENGFQVR